MVTFLLEVVLCEVIFYSVAVSTSNNPLFGSSSGLIVM